MQGKVVVWVLSGQAWGVWGMRTAAAGQAGVLPAGSGMNGCSDLFTNRVPGLGWGCLSSMLCALSCGPLCGCGWGCVHAGAQVNTDVLPSTLARCRATKTGAGLASLPCANQVSSSSSCSCSQAGARLEPGCCHAPACQAITEA